MSKRKPQFRSPTPAEGDRCKRRCHDCGNVAMHAASWTPYVLCGLCGSQDTRLEEPVVDNESVANMLDDDDDPNPPRCKSCGVALREHLGLYGTCKALLEAKAELAFFASLGYTIRKDERGR